MKRFPVSAAGIPVLQGGEDVKNRLSSLGRCCAACALAGLMLMQQAAAGRPAILQFGEEMGVCLRWQPGPPTDVGSDQWELTGRLTDGSCEVAPQGAAGLARRDIRIRFGKREGSVVKTIEKGYFSVRFPGKLIDDMLAAGKSSMSDGVAVTAAYYGQSGQVEAPLTRDEKVFRQESLELAYAGDEQDPDKHIVPPEGSHTLKAASVDWKGNRKDAPAVTFDKPVSADDSKKEAKIVKGNEVHGMGDKPGIVAVRASLNGRPHIRSEPMRLAFGVAAILERIDEHKDEEIILQRPKGYSAQGCVGSSPDSKEEPLFTDEYAKLRFTPTSLLTGLPLKSLEGKSVAWSTLERPPGGNISTYFRSNSTLCPETANKIKEGVAEMTVWARHTKEDKTAEQAAAPGLHGHGTYGTGTDYKRYEVDSGWVRVRVELDVNGGHGSEIEIPFIDSLWLMARPVRFKKEWRVGEVWDIELEVTGYVGPVGHPVTEIKLAKRKFTGFDSRDCSVWGDTSYRQGPVFFNSKKAGKAEVQPYHKPGSGLGVDTGCRKVMGDDKTPICSFAGFSVMPTNTKRLFGTFKALRTGDFCLTQKWISAGRVVFGSADNPQVGDPKDWWGQSGATLHFEQGDKALCGHVSSP